MAYSNCRSVSFSSKASTVAGRVGKMVCADQTRDRKLRKLAYYYRRNHSYLFHFLWRRRWRSVNFRVPLLLIHHTDYVITDLQLQFCCLRVSSTNENFWVRQYYSFACNNEIALQKERPDRRRQTVTH